MFNYKDAINMKKKLNGESGKSDGGARWRAGGRRAVGECEERCADELFKA